MAFNANKPNRFADGLQTVRSLFACLLILSIPTVAQSSPSAFRFKQETESLAKTKVQSILGKFCGESCELISVDAIVDEDFVESDELGFESLAADVSSKLNVSEVVIDIQVDDRVSSMDRERLSKLLNNGLRTLAPSAQVKWSTVALPQIGVSADMEDKLKSQLQQRVQTTVQGIIDQYCPGECLLGNIIVDGRMIPADEARGLNERELVRDRNGRGILRIDNVDVDLSIDDRMDPANRKKVFNLVKAKTKFAYPLNINLSVVEFPESTNPAAKADPWGLERLRQTLQIFRDLAGTKEIITNTQTSSELKSESNSKNIESKENSSTSRENLTEKNTERNSEKEALTQSSNEVSKTDSSTNSELKSQADKNYEYALYVGGFLLFAAILLIIIMRYSQAAKEARMMMEMVPNQNRQHGEQGINGGVSQGALAQGAGEGVFNSEKVSVKFKIDNLRDELIRVMTENPKVAKDVFTRMLQEDGVDLTSKYVHIFGPLVVFELMNDANLQRDLYELSEYYHKSTFTFTDDVSLELLNSLKTRITASEIKILSRRRAEQFDFLQRLDASQVFMLINEEKPQVQSIVLTQLDHQRRRAVFDMYHGENKVSLMRELCRADAIPKEYLANVAKALHKKVMSRNEFDTEQLRSNDILFDLLEKAPLSEQRALMADLVRTNPDAARAIKLKLVTVEMIPFLKDGHLLEIVMGLEREDLLAFLVGTPDHIRELLLSKAPHELAQSWIEDIEQLTGIDEATYRLAELKIINRLRTLANNGAIRLLDINDRIFAEEYLAQARFGQTQVDLSISRNSMAA